MANLQREKIPDPLIQYGPATTTSLCRLLKAMEVIIGRDPHKPENEAQLVTMAAHF